jgi:hypothetical protein
VEPPKYTKKTMEELPKKEAIEPIESMVYIIIGDRLDTVVKRRQ